MSDEKIMDEVSELVDAAKAPGTFNIINLLNERAYPVDEVVIYLDEASAYEASTIKKSIFEYDGDADGLTPLEDKLQAVTEKMKASALTVKVKGITEGKRAEILKDATAKYPLEYTREINPMTGEFSREEKESQERDNLFTEFLWQASIVSLTDANGNVQEDLPYAAVRDMRTSLPLAAAADITKTIEKVRVSTAVFMLEVNEDFLPKS
jgi:hypothetical protein